MTYRFLTPTIAGFLQQLAVGYVCRGYFFYVTGEIPEGKDPAKTDAKLLAQYNIAKSKFTRSRERRQGVAGVQYLRHGRFFVLVATTGRHPFFQREAQSIADIREKPLQFAGHSIGFVVNRGAGHPSVRIARRRFEELKRRFADDALRLSVEDLAVRFGELPFEPFAPVRGQLLTLLRSVNRIRKTASLPLIPATALRLCRKPVKPFE